MDRLWIGVSAAVLIYGMIPFTFGHQVMALTAMTFLAKFFAIGLMRLIALMRYETFPTTVRQTTIGTISVASKIGSISAPFTKELVSFRTVALLALNVFINRQNLPISH